MESTVLFDDESLSSSKELSVEELLTKCVVCINGLKIYEYEYDIKTIEELNRKKERIEKLKPLIVYLGELFRRNGLDLTMTCNISGINKNITYFLWLYRNLFNEYCLSCKNKVGNDGYQLVNRINVQDIEIYEPYLCYNCYNTNERCTVHGTIYLVIKSSPRFLPVQLRVTESIEHITQKNKQYSDIQNTRIYNDLNRMIEFVYRYCNDKLQEIQMVKETMLRIMKTPLLTKELETCMDEILDLNGNRISQLKEYLTEDQYRFVRSGAKFDELEGQQDMLERMNKMLKQLKITSIGQSVLDLPIATPITPEIRHLERELESHKFRQNKYEKDLEKLKK